MPVVEYRFLFHDGREQVGKTDLPEREDDPGFKKRWAIIRTIALEAIGADNDPEHVLVWHEGKYLDMYVDEIGVLKELPFNAKATKIYRANWLAHEPNPGPEFALPHIAGNAVLFMEKVEW